MFAPNLLSGVDGSAYVGGDPVNQVDPSGETCWQTLEFGITSTSRNCWTSGYSRAGHDVAGAFTQGAKDFGSAVDAALPAIHTITGVVAAVASICAVVTSETVIGGATCGTVALVAAAANAVTSAALYGESRETGTTLALDAAGTAGAGVGKVFEVVSVATRAASDTAEASANAYSAEAKSARFFGKIVPSFRSGYYATKAGIWGDVADAFAQGSHWAAAVGFGLATTSTFADGCR